MLRCQAEACIGYETGVIILRLILSLYICMALFMPFILIEPAQAGFWEQSGVCAVFEKGRTDVQTRKIAQNDCVLNQGSGTGYYEQSFTWDDGTKFWVSAENYPDTDYLEFRSKDGPAFYSEQELFDFKSCYITPHESGLIFHCFRANQN